MELMIFDILIPFANLELSFKIDKNAEKCNQWELKIESECLDDMKFSCDGSKTPVSFMIHGIISIVEIISFIFIMKIYYYRYNIIKKISSFVPKKNIKHLFSYSEWFLNLFK